MSEAIFAALIAGISALVGSLIGGVAVIITIVIQLNSQRKSELDSRLFPLRKEAYEKALAVFSRSHDERRNNKKWPAQGNDADDIEVGKALNAVYLYSSKELTDKMLELAGYLVLDIPADAKAKEKEDNIRRELWNDIRMQMRKELGTENIKES